MIFIDTEARPATRSLAALRDTIEDGYAARLWRTILAGAEQMLGGDPYLPGSVVAGRDAEQIKYANPDFVICQATARRLLRAALVHLLTGRDEFRQDALEQLAVLFDASSWPRWRDLAHTDNEADLRTGMLGAAVALSYDWLQGALTAAERDMIVAGLDRCAIRPFLDSVAAGAFWTKSLNNWQTVVVGGLGIVGMVLGDRHDRSAWLVDYSRESMRRYLEILGPDGEFNEAVGYAAALHYPVRYFAALRSSTGAADDILAEDSFAANCRWLMHASLPSGHLVPFGDAHVQAPPRIDYFAAVAAARSDGVLQWFFERHQRTDDDPMVLDPLMLVWYDPTLAATPPDDLLPMARMYGGWGGLIASRSSWTDRDAVAVLAKAGRERNHEHHDDGQMTVDGFGASLIVDLGSPPSYPADFFGPQRHRYYNAGVEGHNLFQFGGRPMRVDKPRPPVYLFRDASRIGAAWSVDLTTAYTGATLVRRSVIHLLPDLVVVLDEADLDQEELILLRWHTADDCDIDANGVFTTTAHANRDGNAGRRPVTLSGQLSSIDGESASFARDEHFYHSPFDRSRLGELFPQRRENYVSTSLLGAHARILTLLRVDTPGAAPAPWPPTRESSLWPVARSAAGGEVATVAVTADTLEVRLGSEVIAVPVARPRSITDDGAHAEGK